MALLLLAACGPSGPSAPDAPDKPGSSETGKDPTDKKTEAQKVAAVVDTLNAVRKDYGNNTPLTMDAEVCAMAEKMAKLQLDWLLGKYGTDPNGKRYTKDWNDISQLPVKGKKLVGVGGYAAYPTESVIRGWVKDTGKWKPANGNRHWSRARKLPLWAWALCITPTPKRGMNTPLWWS